MTDRPLDHWRERMVAALYGELSAEERAELETAMAGDEALRRDWQELTEAHIDLQRLMTSADHAEWGPEALGWRSAPPRPEPVRASPWRSLLAAGLGFAAAASLFVGLLVAGLRVDRTPGGAVVHLDRRPTTSALASGSPTGSPYLTRDELAAVAELLAAGTATRLDQLERRQTAIQAEVAQTLYDALAVAQQRQYRDLRARIELAAYRPSGSHAPGRSTPPQQPWNQ